MNPPMVPYFSERPSHSGGFGEEFRPGKQWRVKEEEQEKDCKGGKYVFFSLFRHPAPSLAPPFHCLPALQAQALDTLCQRYLKYFPVC